MSPIATGSLVVVGALMLAAAYFAGRADVTPTAAPLAVAVPTPEAASKPVAAVAAEHSRFADALYECREGVRERAKPLVVDFDFLGMSKLMPTGLTGTTSDGIVLDGTAAMTVSFTVLDGQVQRTGVCVFLADGKLWGVRLDGEAAIESEPKKPAASAERKPPQRRKPTRKTEPLELPCRPGQTPPCFD